MELQDIRETRKDLCNVKKELQKRIDEGTSFIGGHVKYGLCTMCSRWSTEAFITQHKPSVFSRWFWNKSYFKLQHFQYLIGNENPYHWWNIDAEGNKQRILFIDFLITCLNKEQGI